MTHLNVKIISKHTNGNLEKISSQKYTSPFHEYPPTLHTHPFLNLSNPTTPSSPPHFVKTSSILHTPFFFKLCPTPTLPLLPIVCNLHPHYSFCCLVSLAEWMIVPNYGSTHIVPWYLSTRRILLCVLCNKASSLLKSNT